MLSTPTGSLEICRPKALSSCSSSPSGIGPISPFGSATVPTAEGRSKEQQSVPVRVVARFCPRSAEADEEKRQALGCKEDLAAPWVLDEHSNTVETPDLHHSFHFDKLFGEGATQEMVYENVGRPIVNDVLNGYHGTVLAYGQTGSGKTYCMFGPHGQHGPEVQGLVPRAAQQIFEHVGENCDAESKFTIECQFFEVYCEQLRDILKPGNTKLAIKELPPKGCFIEGLTRKTVTSLNEVLQVLRFGLKHRAAGNTRLNQHSSRSHAIFILRVQQQIADSMVKNGKLTLVDLAGSEKVHKSCSEGDMLEEAKKINLSLSTLGHVIDALVDRRSHVPYRDSRLTRILEDSLGGNCRTSLVIALSNLGDHFAETLSSLRFAARAKKVTNNVYVNVTYACDRQLLNRISHLRSELTKAHRQLERQDSDLATTLPTSISPKKTNRLGTCSTIEEFFKNSEVARAPPGASKEDDGCDEGSTAQALPASIASVTRRLEERLSKLSSSSSAADIGTQRSERFGDQHHQPKGGGAQDDREQVSEQVRNLQMRLELERHRSASLNLELMQRKQTSEALQNRLDDVTEARTKTRTLAPAIPLLGSAKVPLQVLASEQQIGTVVTHAVPPSISTVERCVSRSVTPSRPVGLTPLSPPAAASSMQSPISSSPTSVRVGGTQKATGTPRTPRQLNPPPSGRSGSPQTSYLCQSPSTPGSGAGQASPLSPRVGLGSSASIGSIVPNGTPRPARRIAPSPLKPGAVLSSPRDSTVWTSPRINTEGTSAEVRPAMRWVP